MEPGSLLSELMTKGGRILASKGPVASEVSNSRMEPTLPFSSI